MRQKYISVWFRECRNQVKGERERERERERENEGIRENEIIRERKKE